MADVEFDHHQYEANTYYSMIHDTREEIEKEWGVRWRYILNKIIERRRSPSLLDVGAGNGYFIALAVGEFALRAKGIEISEREIQFAKDVLGIQLINENITQHVMQYDVVTCFNVIEHVVNPKLFLSALVQRVNPGGMLVITTPNPACIHVRVKGLRRWNMIDPPHHINLFTRKSLTALIQSNNLEELHYGTLSTYINFVRSIDSRSMLLKRLFFHFLRILNLGADHLLILGKPSGPRGVADAEASC